MRNDRDGDHAQRKREVRLQNRSLLSGAALMFVFAVWTASWPARAEQAAAGTQAQEPTASPASPQRAVLQKYCIGCHNQRAKTGGLALDTLDLSSVTDDAEVWEKVIRRLRTESMPPAGRPRPDRPTYTSLASWLESEIDRQTAAAPNPGRPAAFHRLNRAEYRNAIRDLLAIDVDIDALLPPDDTLEGGFDNNAAVLTTSRTQLERYLSAAKRISRLAIGIPPARPGYDTYRVHLNLMQNGRMGDDVPLASRGGIGVRHYFPVDGEYNVKIELQENYNGYVRGMGTPQQLDVRLDGVLIKRFTVGGAKGSAGAVTFGGEVFGDAEWEYYLTNADEALDVRFSAKAGPRLISVTFVRGTVAEEGVIQPRQTGIALAANEYYDGDAAVDSVSIGGPYSVAGRGDTPSRRAILVCKPERTSDEEPCARKVLSQLARRAYRRPATEADVQTLLQFYRVGRREGSFDAGIEFALERLLTDPDFLVRIEQDPPRVAPGSIYQIPDLELASRLSFFLWSSIPDAELLDSAGRGRLTKDPGELERQTRRMLADPRAKSLITDFAAQWLNLRILDGVLPDPRLFADFDENLRQSFRKETELFLESTLREDRSVVDLLSANYTFLNERLARHYGIPGVYGERFRRVTFDADSPRGGLLGHGSLLTVTSYATRTSVVLRGKWLLGNIFGTVPPEPPPDVPALPEPGTGPEPRTLRELMETHRRNPACASCHMQMDPLGFALESFDAVGRSRSSAAGQPLDISAVLPSGERFEGPAGLRQFLVTHRNLFINTITEKLLSYSLGRGLQHYDQPTVRQIIRDSASTDYRWSSIIIGVVKSTPFRMRRAQEPAPAGAVASQSVVGAQSKGR